MVPSLPRSHGEREITKYLESHNIEYKHEYRLTEKNTRFDFYLPTHNLAIEYDGVQHSIRIVRIHYMLLNNIKDILEEIFKHKNNLIFTAHAAYNHIINNLDTNIEYLLLLTGVG